MTQRASIEAIAALFPHVVSETKDADGQVVRTVDFEALRQELGDHAAGETAERYGLTWPGKRESQRAATRPTHKTLRPDRDASIDFDTTQHLFIAGDNLDALKLLQPSLLGRVKLIYLDPPYNTGNDFLYADHLSDQVRKRLSQALDQA